jgi:hypothetical protein
MTLERAPSIAEHSVSRAAHPNVTRKSLMADDVTCRRRIDKGGTDSAGASQERLFGRSKRRSQVDYNFAVPLSREGAAGPHISDG